MGPTISWLAAGYYLSRRMLGISMSMTGGEVYSAYPDGSVVRIRPIILFGSIVKYYHDQGKPISDQVAVDVTLTVLRRLMRASRNSGF